MNLPFRQYAYDRDEYPELEVEETSIRSSEQTSAPTTEELYRGNFLLYTAINGLKFYQEMLQLMKQKYSI